jgi:molecular chaperone HtpG
MINSIYTHKEIFLRELLSNASDAIDKLYYKSLSDNLGFSKSDFFIRIEADKDKRTLKIIDNGIGMTADDLDNNLGIIAKSGSLDFKKNNEAKEDINIIGQFGVGFYSSFMVSEKVEVLSRAYGSEEANLWTSSGTEGYEIVKAEKSSHGTEITLHLKPDAEEENYSDFLDEYRIRELVKKYSDYIRYPITMEVEKTREDEEKKEETYKEIETLNSLTPIWKKRKSDIKDEEYNEFYKSAFYDYTDPLKVIHFTAEGALEYKALLFIPGRAPYDYYSRNYEKGLRLYTNGILITEKCAELLPDYFSFVKGLVDSELTLNLSRETVQHDRRLKLIASAIERKIKSELADMLENNREKYEKFFAEFGPQLKYGLYENWGVNKDALKDLVIYKSLVKDKFITFKEYVAAMKEGQKYIYYASGKTADAIKALPQTEKVLDAGYDILCLTEDVDEFAIKVLRDYDKKEFRNVSKDDLGMENEAKPVESEKDKEILAYLKESLGGKVAAVKFGTHLKSHPVCLTSEGELSIGMEKVFNAMPGAKGVSAEKILEINASHPVYARIASLYETDKEKVRDYAEILYGQALLIEGLPLENPAKYSDLVCKVIS